MARTRSYGLRVGLQSGVMPFRYELVPWTWATQGLGSFWRLPLSAVGGIDLRPLPAQSLAGGAPQGFAFAACRQSPGGTAIASSFHMSETPATAGMQSAWQSAMGYSPQGATLTDLLADQLTTGSDPSGQSGPKPLVPGTDGVLRILVGGHSEVWRQDFRWGIHPHTNRLRDLLRRQFEEQWEATNGDDHCRRCLDYTCKKYRVDDWREFIPQRLHAHVPGRLPHATTITDNFTRANGDTIGNLLTWTEVANDWDTENNSIFKANGSGDEAGLARADSDLSSDDHYAQGVTTQVVNSMGIGPAARLPSTATSTCYTIVTQFAGNLYLKKVVAGTATYMVTKVRTSVAGDVMRIKADGSTITGYVDAVEELTTTDSAISGNVRCGVHSYDASGLGGVFDDFEAADLAAATGHPAMRRFMSPIHRPTEIGRESAMVF